MAELKSVVSRFNTQGDVIDVRPLGSGLINDSYFVETAPGGPDYVLQRINHKIFTDVELLQNNIDAVTAHIRRKLEEKCTADIDRKVLRLIPTSDGRKFYYDGENYWRMTAYIPDSVTFEAVTPEYSRHAGVAFGQFQSMLADLPDQLGETIPDFHNMEFRLEQLDDAIRRNASGRLGKVRDIIKEVEKRADYMCTAEKLHRRGELPKRVCHCDTKVNNMLFDRNTGEFLCVIDLDTVMPSYIFSDYGDYLRTAANTGAEDDQDLGRISFDMDIFRAFTDGYLSSAGGFLTPVEIENLPYAVALFPYMQTVRFLADFINGDTYYKTEYPMHNFVRTMAQFRLLQSVEERTPAIREHIAGLVRKQAGKTE